MNNKEENLKELVQYWLKKSQESLDAARDEMKAGRLSFSVNRIYYACFYAVSAVLPLLVLACSLNRNINI